MNSNLTSNQLQLLVYAVFRTEQGGVSEFQKSDFLRVFDIQNYTIQQIKEDVRGLMELGIETKKKVDNRVFFDYGKLISNVSYEHELFTFKWSTDFVEYVLKLKEDLMTDFLKTFDGCIKKVVNDLG